MPISPSNEPSFDAAPNAAGGPSADPRRMPGTGLLGVLIRLARTGESARPATASMPRAAKMNRCEFDYDYYVDLQRRRQARASSSRSEAGSIRSDARS